MDCFLAYVNLKMYNSFEDPQFHLSVFTGPCISWLLVGAGVQAPQAKAAGCPNCLHSCAPVSHRSQAPAPGHPPAAQHSAPLGAGRPGLPSAHCHRSFPLSRYLLISHCNQFLIYTRPNELGGSNCGHFIFRLVLNA